MDDFQVLVAGGFLGPFNVGVDNQYIAQLGLVAGDVTADGSGGPNDDVAKFVTSFRHVHRVDGVTFGDLNSRTQFADLNFDGTTNLADGYLLISNHADAASLDLSTLLSAAVPEPSASTLAVMACLALGRRRLRQK